MADSKSVGLFLLLPAPLNPIGAFDAETFKASFRDVLAANADAKFIGVDLTGIDFVYSDAYNAFMQFHQELSKRNGTFAVLADRESLARSLRKVGLERFIRIFVSADEMASFLPVDQQASALEQAEKSVAEEPVKPAEVEKPAEAAPQETPAVQEVPATQESPTAPVTPAASVVEPKILDKNPLVDETPSSKGSLVAVIVLLLIVIAVVSYLIL